MPTINTIAELEELYAAPGPTSLAKVSPVITPEYHQLINASPFCLISSSGPEGLDCSPRGDRVGFVQVIDSCTLALPDRRGNNQLDTIRNIVKTGKIGLLFLIPGCNETLRVNGTALVTTDTALKERFIVDGNQPTTVIVVTVAEIYFQCARAIIRSGLWDLENQIDRNSLPTAGQMTKSIATDFDAATYDAELSSRQQKTLY